MYSWILDIIDDGGHGHLHICIGDDDFKSLTWRQAEYLLAECRFGDMGT